MNERKKIRFILNPEAGSGLNNKISGLAIKYFSPNIYDIEILITRHEGQAIEMSSQAVKKQFDIVVAVGGDGTVNEVAQSLKNSSIALGIIPTGSGNGFARHFKIPMNVEKAIDIIKKCKTITTDSLVVNDKFCMNIAGAGFDAHIAHLFANYGKRGFNSYVKLVFSEYFSYKEKNYTIEFDGKKINRNALLIAFANASQFGNGAKISPLAIADDGMIDLTVLKKIPILKLPYVIQKIFTGTLNRSYYADIFRSQSFTIISDVEMMFQVDGEPKGTCEKITASVAPKSIRLIVP